MQITVCYPIEIYRNMEVPDNATWDEIFALTDIVRTNLCQKMVDEYGIDSIESEMQEWEKLEDDDANGWDWEIPEIL